MLFWRLFLHDVVLTPRNGLQFAPDCGVAPLVRTRSFSGERFCPTNGPPSRRSHRNYPHFLLTRKDTCTRSSMLVITSYPDRTTVLTTGAKISRLSLAWLWNWGISACFTGNSIRSCTSKIAGSGRYNSDIYGTSGSQPWRRFPSR